MPHDPMQCCNGGLVGLDCAWCNHTKGTKWSALSGPNAAREVDRVECCMGGEVDDLCEDCHDRPKVQQGPVQTANTNTETAGGSRFSTGKPQMWMAPWYGCLEVARVAEHGAGKYGPLDWEEGQSFSTVLNSAMRHLLKAMRNPLARDTESGLLHLGHAAWNILALLDFVERGDTERLDDVTPWQGVVAGGSKWTGSGSTPDKEAA